MHTHTQTLLFIGAGCATDRRTPGCVPSLCNTRAASATAAEFTPHSQLRKQSVGHTVCPRGLDQLVIGWCCCCSNKPLDIRQGLQRNAAGGASPCQQQSVTACSHPPRAAQKLHGSVSAKVRLQVGWGVLHFWERAASLRHRLDAAAGISASQMPGYNLKRGSISITNPIFPRGFIPQLFSSTLGWTFFTFFLHNI